MFTNSGSQDDDCRLAMVRGARDGEELIVFYLFRMSLRNCLCLFLYSVGISIHTFIFRRVLRARAFFTGTT